MTRSKSQFIGEESLYWKGDKTLLLKGNIDDICRRSQDNKGEQINRGVVLKSASHVR